MKGLKEDLFRYTGAKSGILGALWRYPGFKFMFFYRVCKTFSSRHPIGIIARIWYKRLQVKYGFQIPHTSDIDPGLFLGHFGNIVINSGVKIGACCSIAQGVTLGNTSRGKNKGCPKIGQRVWIGANAVVVGNISVGDDVLIAPLTLVNFDVPSHVVVSGNPAQIISKRGSEGYVRNDFTKLDL